MANLRDIRKRILSVKNTQKITSAMKLVAASSFAKSASAVTKGRPYHKSFTDMVSNLITARGEDISSPLLTERKEKKTLLVMVGTDKGLCGGLNTNNFKNAAYWAKERKNSGVDVELLCWGKKASIFAKKTDFKIIGNVEKVLDKPQYIDAQKLASELVDKFLDKSYDRIFLAHNEFKSAMEQNPKVFQLLPIVPDESASEKEPLDTIVEPEIGEVIDTVLAKKVYGDVYRILLEGAASEHGARMTAMEAATNNASEVIKKLTVQYNRARQAAITTELIEIISGAEALQ